MNNLKSHIISIRKVKSLQARKSVTRAKNGLLIPESSVPTDISNSKQIHPMKVLNVDEFETTALKADFNAPKEKPVNDKSFTIEEIRERYKDAYKPWIKELDDDLELMYCEGVNARDMAKHFGQTIGAIRSRIEKLELEEKYG